MNSKLKISVGIAFIILLAIGIYSRMVSDVKFDSKEWAKNNMSRYYMLNNMVNDSLFIGKSTSDVFKLLGKPDMQGDYYNDKYLQYRTKAKSGPYLHWYLFLEIKNDSVVRTQKSLD